MAEFLPTVTDLSSTLVKHGEHCNISVMALSVSFDRILCCMHSIENKYGGAYYRHLFNITREEKLQHFIIVSQIIFIFFCLKLEESNLLISVQLKAHII